MNKQSKKLSQRLEALNLDGTTVEWEDCQHCESIIEAVRELEVANEQLQDAYSKDHLTWKKDAEKLYARLGRDRESLTDEIKWCMHERDALRAKVEALRREYRELEESVGYAEHTAAQSAIRERDEARAEIERLWKTDANQGWKYWQKRFYDLFDEHKIFVSERDAALAKLAAVREWAGTYVNYNCSMTVYPGDALGLFDILDTAPVAAYETQSVSDKPVCGEQVSHEVVTREVVLFKWKYQDASNELHIRSGVAFDTHLKDDDDCEEIARATVTFHVKKPRKG